MGASLPRDQGLQLLQENPDMKQVHSRHSAAMLLNAPMNS